MITTMVARFRSLTLGKIAMLLCVLYTASNLGVTLFFHPTGVSSCALCTVVVRPTVDWVFQQGLPTTGHILASLLLGLLWLLGQAFMLVVNATGSFLSWFFLSQVSNNAGGFWEGVLFILLALAMYASLMAFFDGCSFRESYPIVFGMSLVVSLIALIPICWGTQVDPKFAQFLMEISLNSGLLVVPTMGICLLPWALRFVFSHFRRQHLALAMCVLAACILF